LVKTYRYKSLINLQAPYLLYIFSKLTLIQSGKLANLSSTVSFIANLHCTYFITSFWKIFKKSFTHKLGTTTSNLTKSAYFWFYKQVSNMYDYSCVKPTLKFLDKHSLVYTQTNTLIPFNFTTTTYNTLMFFLINILSIFYIAPQVEFRSCYAFFWKNPNLLTYDFLNRFYFRLKNY